MKYVITGGGTGGHIYPALAFAKIAERRDPNCQILYIGTETGLEKKIVEKTPYPFKAIHITGFRRKVSMENVKTIARFLKAVQKSKKILKEFQPDVVIGTGGYVAGPVVYAAHKLKIPCIIHEQNSIPGLTNKFLSKYVDKVAVSFEDSVSFFPKDKVVFTGNPRAQEVLGHDGTSAMKAFGLDQKKKTVLIFGGSRGAQPINQAILDMLPDLAMKSYQVLYVTGEVHYDKVMEEAKKRGIPRNVHIKPFVHNMQEILPGVDLVISRAGATSIAEFTSLGLASIMIPSPYVTNDHQRKNAEALEKRGAAKVLLEKDLTGKVLLEMIDSILMDPIALERMREKSKEMGIQDAGDRLYNLSLEVMKKASKRR